jgi:hypothetical protein
MAKKTTSARPPSREMLARFCQLREQKRELDAQVRVVEAELYSLHEACMAFLVDRGTRTARVAKYHLLLADGQAVVRWKDEFIRVAGADAAAKVAKAALRARRLEITAPS